MNSHESLRFGKSNFYCHEIHSTSLESRVVPSPLRLWKAELSRVLLNYLVHPSSQPLWTDVTPRPAQPLPTTLFYFALPWMGKQRTNCIQPWRTEVVTRQEPQNHRRKRTKAILPKRPKTKPVCGVITQPVIVLCWKRNHKRQVEAQGASFW